MMIDDAVDGGDDDGDGDDGDDGDGDGQGDDGDGDYDCDGGDEYDDNCCGNVDDHRLPDGASLAENSDVRRAKAVLVLLGEPCSGFRSAVLLLPIAVVVILVGVALMSGNRFSVVNVRLRSM